MKNILLLGWTLSLSLISFSQITVDITPDKDNSIYSESGSLSNGQGKLFSGRTNMNDDRRALLHFDIAGNLPAGVTITNVTLDLVLENSGPGATNDAYDLHPLTQDWGEGASSGSGTGAAAVAPDATWTDAMFGTTTWTSAGGDFLTSVATSTVGNTPGVWSWSDPNMVTNVQAWLDTPSSNFGWILIGDETTTGSARRFGSAEQGSSPVLHVEYTCATPPTASCQGQIIYLGALGDSTLLASDFDGGSVSNCGGNLSFNATQLTFNCSDIQGPVPDGLVLTAAYDGDLTGGLPKGIELYAYNYIPDLSAYGVGSANNGGGTDGEEFTFPAIEVPAGTYIYVTSDSAGFHDFFGFAADYVDFSMGINGDDAIELFKDGTVIDVFGDINVDGTGQAWEYADGWAYRNNSTGPDGSTFTIGNWTFSGPNSLDSETSNSTAANPVPIQTYTQASTYGIDVTLTVTDDFSNTNSCVANVVVFDTLAPTANCETDPTFSLDANGDLTLTVADIDSNSVDACGIQSSTISQTTFDCTDQGTVPVTLTVTDIYGNVGTCVSTVGIDASNVVMITQDSLTNPTCFGDQNGAIYVSLSGGDPNPYTIDWDVDGTGDNDDTEDQTNLGEGTYEITVMDANGCISQDTFILTAPPAIDTSLSFDGTVLSSNENGAVYQWMDCGTMTAISGETSQDFTPTADGDYMVVITQGACTDSSACFTVDGLSIGGESLSFELYPNPTNGLITVRLNSNDTVQLRLLDIKGSQLLQRTVQQQVQIDMSAFENGVYFIELQASGEVITKKIILQR